MRTVNGRTIGDGAPAARCVERLQSLYQEQGARTWSRAEGVTVRVAMWRGPRNISTAMMRAWENRPDTVVVDEPFYAEYLVRTGLDHPGRDEVIASQPTDAVEVVRRLTGDDSAPVHYAKHMTHHLARGHGPRLGRRLPQRAAHPRSGRGGGVLRPVARGCEPEDIGLLQQVPVLAALPGRTRS